MVNYQLANKSTRKVQLTMFFKSQQPTHGENFFFMVFLLYFFLIKILQKCFKYFHRKLDFVN